MALAPIVLHSDYRIVRGGRVSTTNKKKMAVIRAAWKKHRNRKRESCRTAKQGWCSICTISPGPSFTTGCSRRVRGIQHCRASQKCWITHSDENFIVASRSTSMRLRAFNSMNSVRTGGRWILHLRKANRMTKSVTGQHNCCIWKVYSTRLLMSRLGRHPLFSCLRHWVCIHSIRRIAIQSS